MYGINIIDIHIIMFYSYCNNHGDLVDGSCSCDWGWFSDDCSTNALTYWSSASWSVFCNLFGALYLAILLISLLKLYSTLSQDKIVDFRRLFNRMFRSPKNLCLLLLIMIGTLRAAWLLTDPLLLKNNLSRIQERLLFETVYPLIYGLYSSILLVWGGLYQGMRSKNSDPFKILRKLIMGMMILAFPISITISTLKGYRLYEIWYPFAISFVVAGVLLLFLSFGIFGILLLVYVEKNADNDEAYIERLDSSERNYTSRFQIFQNTTSSAILKKRKFIENYEKNKELSWDELSADDKCGIDIKLSSDEIHYSPRKKKRDATQQKVLSLITEEDRIILRKLVILFALSIILGFIVMILIPMLATHLSKVDPYQELLILYFALSIEVISCFSVYMVFTTQIKVKDKNYLRAFSSLSLTMNKQTPHIRYTTYFTKIVPRLHDFYENR